MAVFQAKTRPELNECLQRVQSVCGVNTDIRSSSGAGSSQEQQQHKQLMGKLRQLLDSRSAELKILRAQVILKTFDYCIVAFIISKYECFLLTSVFAYPASNCSALFFHLFPGGRAASSGSTQTPRRSP